MPVSCDLHYVCLIVPLISLQAGQISYEEAILARQQLIQDRKEQVQKFQDESRRLMDGYFAQKSEEQQEMRRLVEATTAGQQNVREARNKLTAMKQKIGKLAIELTHVVGNIVHLIVKTTYHSLSSSV